MGGSNHEHDEDLEEWSEDYSGQDLGLASAHVGSIGDARGGIGEERVWSVGVEQSGQRIDHVLSQAYPEVSRSQLQRWITDGHVRVDDRTLKSSALVRPGQAIVVRPPPPEAVNDWIGQPMRLDIVFEDADVMVVNKPAGLVVHPAAGHAAGTLVNGLIAHCPDIVQVARAGIVHRLDRDTSGLMVVAKTSAAQFSLVHQLQARTVSRQYLALAWGPVRSQEIRTHMGRDPRDRQRMAVLAEGKGKEAITEFRVLGQGVLFGVTVTLLMCSLKTGRTHQIRVHAEHIKSPLVGDRTYSRHAPHAKQLHGGKEKIEDCIPGQALHAYRLRFLHPARQEPVEFTAPASVAFVALCTMAGIDLERVLR